LIAPRHFSAHSLGWNGPSCSPIHRSAQAQQIAFIDAARQSGVAHIVKLSQFGAEAHSPVRFLRYHAAVEAALQASDIAYTLLHPNLFMQGLLNFRSTIATRNAFYAVAGDAKVSVIDLRDIAHVAVAALTEAGHEGKLYDLTVPPGRALQALRIDSRGSRAVQNPRHPGRCDATGASAKRCAGRRNG
jgi:uncharacterized protein YbjT (DUF2867 family)